MTEKATANKRHWGLAQNYRPSWDRRAAHAALFINAHSSVCDIGCGPRQSLRAHLPDGCTYYPCDMKPWNAAVEICDLNRGDWPVQSLSRSDIVVLLGVLEYLSEPAGVFEILSSFVPTIVFSYHPSDYGNSGNNLWYCALPRTEIVSALGMAGYSLVTEFAYRRHQSIFLARKGVTKQPVPLSLLPRHAMSSTRRNFDRLVRNLIPVR
jgi:hypothetical protein